MKSACAGMVDATRWSDALGREYSECDEWRARALDRIDAIDPDLVVASSSVGSFASIDASEWKQGIRSVASRLDRAGHPLLLLRDTPRPGFDAPSCLSKSAWLNETPEDACTFDTANGQDEEVFAAHTLAVRGLDNVVLDDLNASICPEARCPTLREDSLVVWRDDNHLTATFARTLAPVLEASVEKAFPDRLPWMTMDRRD